jgi:hypothetical protein
MPCPPWARSGHEKILTPAIPKGFLDTAGANPKRCYKGCIPARDDALLVLIKK